MVGQPAPHTGSSATTKPHFMARSIKIGDEITTSILNSVETTITANLLSGDVKPNFAACKAVATRLQNYVLACEAHYNELQAAAKAEAEAKASAKAEPFQGLEPWMMECLEEDELRLLAKALLSKVQKPKASKPKAKTPAKPAPKKAKPSKSAKPKKSVGQRLAAKAGQGRKAKNTVLEAKQQAAFVSQLSAF